MKHTILRCLLLVCLVYWTNGASIQTDDSLQAQSTDEVKTSPAADGFRFNSSDLTPIPLTTTNLHSTSHHKRSNRHTSHHTDEHDHRSDYHTSSSDFDPINSESDPYRDPNDFEHDGDGFHPFMDPAAHRRRRTRHGSASRSGSGQPRQDENDEPGVNDENIFDEAHQQKIAHMYPDDDSTSPSSQHPIVSSPSPEQLNPYEYPGMVPNESPSDWDYAITIDAGSSGSRVHIYKWQHRHSPSSIPPFSPLFTKHAWSETVSPGISTFVNNPQLVIPQLVTLLEFARNSLSAFRYKWNRTPVYLKATAGMRLIKNLPSRDRIMETIRTFLSDPRQNPFYFERTMARVISGEEEGVYGWMTTNYLSGRLMHASSATSYGALDMGGASVQITFRPPFDVLSNYFPLRLQQERIRLYSHSFLNFGVERALERVNDRLIELGNSTTYSQAPISEDGVSSSFFLEERDGVKVFRHPCFPLGFSFTYVYVRNMDLGASFGGRRSSPFIGDAEDGADLSPITTYSEANSEREMVVFEGGQDFGNCSAITWQLLHKKAPCFDNTCSFDGIYQPRFGNVTFLAFSEFSKVVRRDLELPRNATLGDIDRKARQICSWNWQKLQDVYRYAKVDDLSKLCFNARYIFTVLYKGFGFPYEGTHLRFIRSILNLDINWALGSTLYEANAMPFDIDGRHGKEDFIYHLPRTEDTPTTAPTATTSDQKSNANKIAHAREEEVPVAGREAIKQTPAMRHEQEKHHEEEMKYRKQEDRAKKEYAHEAPHMRPRLHKKDDDDGTYEYQPSSHHVPDLDEAGNPVSTSTDSNAATNTCPATTSNQEETNPWVFPQVWAIVGFLSGGWLVTGIAFALFIKQANRLRYEPIQDELP